MALAVILGVIAGVASCLPLLLGLRGARRMSAQSSAAGYLTPVLVAVGGSMVVLVAATLICIVFARDIAMPFVVAEAATLVVGALGFGVYKMFRN